MIIFAIFMFFFNSICNGLEIEFSQLQKSKNLIEFHKTLEQQVGIRVLSRICMAQLKNNEIPFACYLEIEKYQKNNNLVTFLDNYCVTTKFDFSGKTILKTWNLKQLSPLCRKSVNQRISRFVYIQGEKDSSISYQRLKSELLARKLK